MNAVKLKQRIDELEAQREREYEAWLRSLSDDQLKLIIDGLRAIIRGEPANVAAAALIARSPDFPAQRRRELTPEEQAQIDAFVRGDLVVGASGHFVVAAGGPQEGKGHEPNGSHEAA